MPWRVLGINHTHHQLRPPSSTFPVYIVRESRKFSQLHYTSQDQSKGIPAPSHCDNSHRILWVRVKKSGIIVINYNLNCKASNTGIKLCIKASWSVISISRICGVVNTNKLNKDSNSYQKTICANPDMIYLQQ